MVFTTSINPDNGEVTVTQYQSLQHSDTTNRDDSVSPLTASIQATVTVAHVGGSVSNSTKDIGNMISFEDDGPEILSLSNTLADNDITTNFPSYGALVIDEGADDELFSVKFSGQVPSGLKTADGDDIHYDTDENGILTAYDEQDQEVFILKYEENFDAYSLDLKQVLQSPEVTKTISINGGDLDAGQPIDGVIQVDQGVLVNLWANDDLPKTNPATLNPSGDGFGVNDNLVDEKDGDEVVISLDDPDGIFNSMSVTVGNFSTAGAKDVLSYQLFKDGIAVGEPVDVVATESSESPNTTTIIDIDSSNPFDEIHLSASHDSGNSKGSYKIINIDAEVTAISSEDVVLDFGVDVTDGDGDSHGGDFKVAIDTNGDGDYPQIANDFSLDDLIIHVDDNDDYS